jgi:RHS repeat-associated protein
VGQTNPLGQTLTYDALGRVRTTSTSLALPGLQTQVVTKTSSYRGIAEDLVESNTSVNLTGDITSIDVNFALAPDGVLAQRDSVTTPLGSTTTSLELIGSGPHQDVTYLTGMNGQVVGSKAYDPWGVLIAESGTESTDLGFQSDPTDEDTGLVDMGARHYLPELGRFLTQDPMRGEPTAPFSQNRAIYGLNDPASLWDPTGYCPKPSVCGPDPRTDHDHQERQVELTTAPSGDADPRNNWSWGPPYLPDIYYEGEPYRIVEPTELPNPCAGGTEDVIEHLTYASKSNVPLTFGKTFIFGANQVLKNLIETFHPESARIATFRLGARGLVWVSAGATAIDVSCDIGGWLS